MILIHFIFLALILHADLGANVTAALVPLISLTLLSLVVLMAGLVAAKKHFNATKLTVCIMFSVEDKPKSLTRALEVFKDYKVNILGLNTHLCHAEFNQDAGRGYNFNYIHCMCTKKDKEFLKNELKAEFEGGS